MTLDDIRKNYYFMENVCFEHDEGWAVIIDRFCLCLKYLFEKEKNDYEFEILQIKEKYGELVIYYSFNEHAPEPLRQIVQTLVNELKERSNIICERCGEYGSARTETGWIHIYCDKCEEEYLNKLVKRKNK
jgi:hypothetical protein